MCLSAETLAAAGAGQLALRTAGPCRYTCAKGDNRSNSQDSECGLSSAVSSDLNSPTTEELPSPPAAKRRERQQRAVRFSPAADFVCQRKVTVFGSSAAGKSSLVRQYVDREFSLAPAFPADRTWTKKCERAGRRHLISILDTAGQDELGFFDPQYTIGTDAFILVYSVTDRESFNIVQRIHRELWAYGSVPCVLVATKVDLATSRVVSLQEGADLARSWGCTYTECSARSAGLVDRVFELLLDQVDATYGLSPPACSAPAEPAASGSIAGCISQ